MGLATNVARVYVVFFTIYLPVSRIVSLPSFQRLRWILLYVASLIIVAVNPMLPKSTRKKWELAEAAQLQATNVAISQLSSCVQHERCTEVEFADTCRRLLTAIRQDVEAQVVDSESIYINATLMVQHESKSEYLQVLVRARDNRGLAAYPKEGLYVWKAMCDKEAVYVPAFCEVGKEYRSILALPLVRFENDGSSESVGVVSIDSGRKGEFDGMVDRIELRLLPYLSLLKLALSIRTAYGRENVDRN